MVYLFFGKDNFRIKKKLHEWTDEWMGKNGQSGLIRLDAKNIDFEDLRSEVFSYSMFSAKKFVIIENVSLNAKLKESIAKAGDNFANSENVILFIEYDFKPLKSDPFFNFLTNKGIVEQFDILEEQALVDWATKEIADMGIAIKKSLTKEMAISSRGDLWQLTNDIQKICNYVLAENRKEITSSDVNLVINKYEDGNIFAITDAIGNRDRAKALLLINDYLKNGGIALILFATIATHIKNLMIIKESPKSSAGELGIAPFVKMKCSSQAEKFGIEELKNIFNFLVDLDRQMKIGQIGQIEAVESFIISL